MVVGTGLMACALYERLTLLKAAVLVYMDKTHESRTTILARIAKTAVDPDNFMRLWKTCLKCSSDEVERCCC